MMRKLTDPRIELMCTYVIEYMIFTGILFFILKLEYKRRLHRLKGTTFIKNLNKFLGVELDTATHYSNLDYFLRHLGVENLEKLRYWMIQQLIRGKVLVKYRLFNKYYLIAIDGTGNLTYKERHCPKCLVRKAPNGKYYYYHPVLEAKIITSNGLALSICTEFVENEKEINRELTEDEIQDCELKAAYRLLKKLKKYFPQLRICILGDSLYANQQIMQICKDNDWKYIITFKEGSIPNVYKEFESLKNLKPENIKKVNTEINLDKEEVEQTFRWINEIDHEGHSVNIIDCKEYKIKSGEKKRFVFITNFEITKENVDYLSTKGGRLRWKIENEGFNVQKNKGYNLEHHFSDDDIASKNYYLLMQIAHIINQLVEKSNLLKPFKEYFVTIEDLSNELISDLNKIDIDFDKIFKYSNQYIILDPG